MMKPLAPRTKLQHFSCYYNPAVAPREREKLPQQRGRIRVVGVVDHGKAFTEPDNLTAHFRSAGLSQSRGNLAGTCSAQIGDRSSRQCIVNVMSSDKGQIHSRLS